MASPFLLSFSEALVSRLWREGHLIVQGDPVDVVRYLAAHLGQAKQGDQLISTVSRVLIACPSVEELFADNDQIKQIVQDLAP